MTTVALIRRGWVEQIWLNKRADQIDARLYDGDLIEVEGPVSAGMRYENGRFSIAPPRVLPEAIRNEASRRIERVFPEATQAMIASAGGEMASRMVEYVRAVHARAQAFLGMEAAPADFRSDGYWPPVPSLEGSLVPIVVPAASPVPALPAPQEVRVVVEQKAAPQIIEHRTVEHALPAQTSNLPATQMTAKSPAHVPGSVALELATPAEFDILALLKTAVEGAIQEFYDAHKGAFTDPEAHNRWLDQLTAFAAEVRASTTVAGVEAAKTRMETFISGGR